jgi:alpha-tubulin suppressor-like RCC1 family protein
MAHRRLIFCALYLAGCASDTSELGLPAPAEAPRDEYALRPAHLASGPEHTCLLREDEVWCWGSNDNGQITPGVWNVYEGNPLPTRAEGVEAAMIAAGGNGAQAHNCVVQSSGRLLCYGSGWNGQLGDMFSNGVAEPGALSDITTVAAGGSHSCAIDRAGSLYCWGDNRLGQLGTGRSSMPNPVPEKIPLENKAIAVALGNYHSCVLDEAARVWCWGNNSGFQLGVDVRSSVTPSEGGGIGCRREERERCVNPSPLLVDSLPPIIRLNAAYGATCAIDVEGAVWCWGYDQYQTGGELPRRIEGLEYNFRVAAGQDHTCAINKDREVWCWGANPDHQLGAMPRDGSNHSREPLRVEGVSGAIELSSGTAHSCALTEDGTVWCWGSNLKGQLGRGTEARLVVELPGKTVLEDTISLSARATSGCAVTGAHRAFCWGRMYASWSGKNALLPAAVPTFVSGLPEVRSIETSGGHACALTLDGQAWCWGGNESGQISIDAEERVDDPQLVESGPSMKLALGGQHSCALGQDRQVRCWGDNSRLQLGAPAAHMEVPGLFEVQELAAQGTRTCVIDGVDRGMTCWGSINNGTPAGPTRVPGLSNLVSMALGNSHNCAFDRSGRVFCFGSNSRGQLGDGCRYPTLGCEDHSEVPVEVRDIPPMRALSASDRDTCGISAIDGALWCWGDAYGAWTETPEGPRFKPVRVQGAPESSREMRTGRNFACVLSEQGSVRCWGSNLSGEIGDGVRFSTIPVQVSF